MNIVVRGRNINITSRLEEYVDKKVGKLDRFLPTIDEARMELAVEETRSAQHSQIAQLTVRSRGRILRVEERDQDIFAAIDAVAEKMQRQIRRYKGRLRGAERGAESIRTPNLESLPETESEEEPLGAIVRTKKFPVTPMDAEEAIEQMELLGHDFFVFFNSEVNGINVLYRRKTGDYGLLQPELA
jgi:putative sigma-54 modulation protein